MFFTEFKQQGSKALWFFCYGYGFFYGKGSKQSRQQLRCLFNTTHFYEGIMFNNMNYYS